MAGIGFDNALHYKAYPGSYIGRQIAFYHFRFADTNNDGVFDQGVFRKAMQVIQTGLEVMWASVPYVSDNYGAFRVMVSYDTANPEPQNGDSIQTQLQNVLEDGNIVFRREFMMGGNWMTQDDFLSYVDSNFAKDENGIPVVYTGVEQDELAQLYLAWV